MKNAGISLMSLVITIILIIIIASISLVASNKSLDEATKVKFQNDLKEVVTALEVYHQRAYIRGVSTYDSKELKWDGMSESAENTARIEDSTQEDTIQYILEGNVPESLKGIITFENGKVKVDQNRKPEIEWATELYSYMGE